MFHNVPYDFLWFLKLTFYRIKSKRDEGALGCEEFFKCVNPEH
ncbi:hypothetical protein Cabys_1972 [Caldithrix abyssi DSM 13497]|uniref:Uncharacterized protein n=1 Tax=Caldithrix abyssi DSM 13497 TaxID=880073 RepID=A0A1J1C8Y0_CALAY|nr:hypothetical protein Cabys_1972 [Caldithrix abyssi DSM 13497]